MINIYEEIVDGKDVNGSSKLSEAPNGKVLHEGNFVESYLYKEDINWTSESRELPFY